MEIFIVIPTIRNLDFLKSWKDEFKKCHLIIVEDHPEITIKIPKGNHLNTTHYTWQNIREDFGKDEWIFSRRNAGIRCYGFWKAYQKKADVIITIDDDCYPVGNDFIRTHIDNLTGSAPDSWFATFPHPQFMFTRGFPYQVRNKKSVVISHGLWSNKIDLDGKNQLIHQNINIPPYPPIRQFVPSGMYFPMCSMNLAFARTAAPLMYFPLMGFDKRGNSWGYDRFDDIWAGIFAKKITDHLGMAIVNGSPFVEHRKASDSKKNIIKERTGLRINERLWRWVNEVKLTRDNPADCYMEIAHKTYFPQTEYFERLRKAMIIWSNL